jgi:hypothetical protein
MNSEISAGRIDDDHIEKNSLHQLFLYLKYASQSFDH